MALRANGPAPYTSAAAAILAIEVYRDRGFNPITTDALIRAGITESLSRRTLHSLRLLELVDDDGKPTARFETFRQARGEEEFKENLADWIRDVYADVLLYVDPAKDSYERVVEAFRTFEPQGQRRSMAALLVGLWRRAGLPTEAIAATSASGDDSPKTPRPKSVGRKDVAKRTTVSAESRRIQQPSAMEGTADLPPALVGLLRQIPGVGGTWTKEERSSFLTAFTAVLDFSVRVGNSAPNIMEKDEVEP